MCTPCTTGQEACTRTSGVEMCRLPLQLRFVKLPGEEVLVLCWEVSASLLLAPCSRGTCRQALLTFWRNRLQQYWSREHWSKGGKRGSSSQEGIARVGPPEPAGLEGGAARPGKVRACLQADEGHRHAVADEVDVEGVSHVVCKPGKRGANGWSATGQICTPHRSTDQLALALRLQLPKWILKSAHPSASSLPKSWRAYSPTRLSMGPLPVAAYWAAKPRKPIMARRPLRISFHLYLSVCAGRARTGV